MNDEPKKAQDLHQDPQAVQSGGADKRPPHLRRPRLRRVPATEYLLLVHGIERAPATLAKLASVGGGPRMTRVGRIPYYDVDELDAWARKLLGAVAASTSEL
jgi:hypothetical protein